MGKPKPMDIKRDRPVKVPEATLARYAAFADAYVLSNNATESAIHAGYARKSAHAEGCRLLTNVKVQVLVLAAQQKLAKKNELTRDMIIGEYRKLAFSNIRFYMAVLTGEDVAGAVEALTDEQTAAIAEITVERWREGKGEDAVTKTKTKLKMYSKKDALDSLARIFGMFDDKLRLLLGEERPDLSELEPEEIDLLAKAAAIMTQLQERKKMKTIEHQPNAKVGR